MFLLKKKPKFASDSIKLNGYKPDYNGIGVFLYKNNNGDWTIVANHNKGMTKIQDLQKISSENNSCKVSTLDQREKVGIRV